MYTKYCKIMTDANEIFIYKENSIENIKPSLPFYKKLAINFLAIDMGEFINDDYLAEIFSINETLKKEGMGLMLRLDLLILSQNLIDSKVDDLTWENTKVKRAGLSFLNFLVKRGICAFDFLNLSKMLDNRNLLKGIREINKNVRHLNENVITTSLIEDQEVLRHLSRGMRTDFSFVRTKIDCLKHEDLSRLFSQGPNFAISFDNFNNTNLTNYEYFSKSQVLSNIFALKGPVYLDASKIDIKTEGPFYDIFYFMKEILKIRDENNSLRQGDFLEIFKKDKDILAYIRSYKNEKALVINNLSQKEFLLPISMYLADYSSYKLALGNYGQRTMVDNLLVRPFETLIFIKK